MYVSASPSTSLALTVKVFAAPLSVVIAWVAADTVGASFSGVIVMFTVCVTEAPLGSFTVTTKLSVPLALSVVGGENIHGRRLIRFVVEREGSDKKRVVESSFFGPVQ